MADECAGIVDCRDRYTDKRRVILSYLYIIQMSINLLSDILDKDLLGNGLNRLKDK